MVIREGQRFGDRPAGRPKILEEAERLGDSCNGKNTIAILGRSEWLPAYLKDRRRRVGGFHDNVVIRRQDRIGSNDGVEGFAKATRWQRLGPVDVFSRENQQIDISIQLKMLKPIVEHVHRGSEMMLGEPSGEIAIGARDHRHTWKLPREHQRLVPRAVDIRAHAFSVAHDDNTVAHIAASVSSAENRGTFAHFEQHPGDRRRDGSLSTSSDRKIANAHNWVS